MKISPGLLLKSMMGAAAATAATTAAAYGENIYSFFATGSFEIIDETEKIASLALPIGEDCKWPERYSKEPAVCELDSNKLKKINFYEGGNKTISSVEGGQNFILTIERIWGDRVFDKGYKFILKSKEGNNDVTVKQNSQPFFYLPKNLNLEFKIKEDGGKWYLEKAWDEKAIRERIGLDCSSNVCSLNGRRKINVMIGDSKVEGISGLNNKTIKLHKNIKDYQQGLKFSIEGGDINLSGGKSTVIKKFEEEETYEIKQNEGKWYLSRKTSAIDAINEKLKGLNLPAGCKMDEKGNTVGCDGIKNGGLTEINFDGKEGSSLTATGADDVTLKLERTGISEFSSSKIKIIFENSKDVIIKKNSNGTFAEWKKGTNTEYKIKGSGNAKTLEKAWRLIDIAEKVGLTSCKNNNTDTCTFTTSFNVMDGSKNAIGVNANLKTLKYAEGVENYNQGFKFTAEVDHSFSGGRQNGVSKLKKGATYEIKDIGGKWYLVKKTLSTEEQNILNEINNNIKNLGIAKEECKFKGDEEVKTCKLSANDLKTVKFDSKGSENLTVADSDEFDLKIEKIFQNGSKFGDEKLKFEFTSVPSDVKVSSTVILEKNTKPEFKIKKGSGSDLTLERV